MTEPDQAEPETSPPTRTINIDTALHAELKAAAKERTVSIQLLADRAVRLFLDDLLPLDEIRWTRSGQQ